MLSKFWIELFDSLETTCLENRLFKKKKTRENKIVLRSRFPGQVISRFGDIEWAARSLDLSPLDFFLWGYLKGRVYHENPPTLGQLKEAIKTEIWLISREMTSALMKTMQKRAESCIASEGRL